MSNGKALWQPDSFQLAWAKAMLKNIKNEGIWATQDNGFVFKFMHETKQIHMLEGDPEHEWFIKTAIMFSKFGYKMIYRTEEGTEDSG